MACALPDRRIETLLVRAGVVIAALIWAALLWPRVAGTVSPGELFEPMGYTDSPIELGRELGGLCIIGVWSLVLVVGSVVAHRRASP